MNTLKYYTVLPYQYIPVYTNIEKNNLENYFKFISFAFS